MKKNLLGKVIQTLFFTIGFGLFVYILYNCIYSFVILDDELMFIYVYLMVVYVLSMLAITCFGIMISFIWEGKKKKRKE